MKANLGLLICLFCVGITHAQPVAKWAADLSKMEREQKWRDIQSALEKEQRFQKVKESLQPKPEWRPQVDFDAWKRAYEVPATAVQSPATAAEKTTFHPEIKAGIGSTPRKFAERFGLPESGGNAGELSYRHQDFKVLAHFSNGRCDFLRLVPQEGRSFSDADVEKFRREYCGERTWLAEKQERGDKIVWSTSDYEVVSEVDEQTQACGIYIFEPWVVESLKQKAAQK